VKALSWAVDRPLPVFLIAAVIVLLGAWSLSRLPVNRAPDIEIPYALVVATYEGAAPEDVESELSIEIEERLNTLQDLRHMTTVAREGFTTLFLEFEDRTDMDESVRKARDEADLAFNTFPEDADRAWVRELSLNDEPVVFFTLTGAPDLARLREIAEDLEPDLESVAGVAEVEVFGGQELEVQVLADPAALLARGLTLQDLAATLARHGRSIPAGELRTADSQRLIRATGEIETLEELRTLSVGSGSTGPLALQDVATVRVGHVRPRSGAWWNGEPSVTLIVRPRADVDTLETVRRLRARVEAFRADLPPGVRIVANADQSEDIRRMLGQLGTSAGLGMLLVVAVLLAVFGARQALLVSSVLPLSLLFTVIGLLVLDMEISNIALFAMILVLGLVVDGAIVVAESIQAEREAGASPKVAAKSGLSRVGMPVISADLTTLAAFAPMLLMVGVMGQFMSVLPKVVMFALVGSVFVDHLLLPAAAGRMKGAPRRRTDQEPTGVRGWISPDIPRLRRLYARALERALRRPALVIGGSTGAFLLAAAIFASGAIGSIFMPGSDRGRFDVNFELPPGTSLEETSRVGRLLDAETSEIREVESTVLTTGDTGALNARGGQGGQSGPSFGRLTVELVPEGERERDQRAVAEDLRARLAPYAGVTLDVRHPDEGPPTGSALAVRVKGEDLDQLSELADEVQLRVDALAEARDVRVDYDRGTPEIRVELDRVRAAERFGVDPEQVSAALLTAFYGIEVGRMWLGGERVDVRLQASEAHARSLDHARELPLRAASGQLVPLGEVADVRLGLAPNAIFRHDTERTITVRADAASGSSSVALEDAAREALASVELPPGFSIGYGGESEERDRSYASLADALQWGVLLIFVIMAIQFDSLLQPLIVLLSVPLAVVGVTAGLLVTGTPFSFLVFIGIVSLTGIVVNSGIVLIDTINRRRRAGMPLRDAIREGSLERLRPVLLTAITTIVGLLPLTLGIGGSGDFWRPLGVAIISGLVASTSLTLFVVPVLYALLHRGRSGALPERQRERSEERSAAEGTPASVPDAV
jgi:CzcA family heavy metal efflux pump